MASKKKATETLPPDTTLPDEYRTPAAKEIFNDFGGSHVLMTHPSINGGEPVHCRMSGYWASVPTSRSSIAVTRVEAHLTLPTVQVRFPRHKRTVQVSPGTVYLTKGVFDVPDHLQELFPDPNVGIVQARKRHFRTVLGMHAKWPFAFSESGRVEDEIANLLLLVVGSILPGGVLVTSGLGRLISGSLEGLMFCCASPPPPPPPPPPPCGVPHPTLVWTCQKVPFGHGGGHVNYTPSTPVRW